MSDPVSTDQWLEWAASYTGKLGLTRYAKECDFQTMKVATSHQTLGDPIYWLHYYANFMNLFASELCAWEMMVEALQDQYEILYSSKIIEGVGKVSEKKSSAKSQLNGLSSALTWCKMAVIKCRAEYKAAEIYKDVVSRTVTVYDKDKPLKGTPNVFGRDN